MKIYNIYPSTGVKNNIKSYNILLQGSYTVANKKFNDFPGPLDIIFKDIRTNYKTVPEIYNISCICNVKLLVIFGLNKSFNNV
jgi:hypothetical protein